MISTRSVELVIDTVVCLTLAKWETVSGQFGGYLMHAGGARSDTVVTLMPICVEIIRLFPPARCRDRAHAACRRRPKVSINVPDIHHLAQPMPLRGRTKKWLQTAGFLPFLPASVFWT